MSSNMIYVESSFNDDLPTTRLSDRQRQINLQSIELLHEHVKQHEKSPSPQDIVANVDI